MLFMPIEFDTARSTPRLVLKNSLDRRAVHFALFGLWHAIYRDDANPVRNGRAKRGFENTCAPRYFHGPACPWLNQRIPRVSR
jgi:hypothetical protein